MIILVDKHEEINLVQSIDSDGQNEVLSFKYFAEIMQNNEISQNYNDFKDYLSLLKKFNMNEEEIDFEFSNTKDKDACHVYNSILPYTQIGIEANNKIDNYFKKHMKNG